MPISVKQQILALSHSYARHGEKQNRKQQIRRLLLACDWIAMHHNINALEQIGKRQIISFYQQHAHLAYTTMRAYHYAFCELWNWLGKNGEPPRPTQQQENSI